MKKTNRKMLVLTTLVCLLPILLGLALYGQLPQQVAVHWNSAGDPDNFAPKLLAVLGLPALMAAIHLVVQVMAGNDPKRKSQPAPVRLLLQWLIPVTSVVLVPITLFIAMGMQLPVEIIAPALCGVLITILGNYMPKCKQNYTVGIRLPWTLHSEENWNRTHRVAGYLWTVGGLCLLALSCLRILYLPVSVTLIALLIIVPLAYSFYLYKKGM